LLGHHREIPDKRISRCNVYFRWVSSILIIVVVKYMHSDNTKMFYLNEIYQLLKTIFLNTCQYFLFALCLAFRMEFRKDGE
jgi:DNA integrity scanning protein DisA with diadenylate cyclase activity